MEELRVPALEVKQGHGVVYVMGLDGKQVSRFATTSRLKRTEGALVGYQRPEALAHVHAIREYMQSPGALVPNAVVLSFNASVRFEPGPGESSPCSTPGALVIPLPGPEVAEEEYPGFVVDGQQRLAAVRDAEVEAFPLAICAFIARDMAQQVEQFVLVNSVKPLPRALIHELLPSTKAHLPVRLERKRLPATLLERLNLDEDSPLRGMVITQTNPRQRGKGAARTFSGLIQDTALLNALENSLSDGALHAYLHGAEPDTEGMLQLLKAFWRAVAGTFPSAWGKSPKESRLMHGAGVVSVSFLMDAAVERLWKERGASGLTTERLKEELRLVKGDCAWTEGAWKFPRPTGARAWNEIQNTSQHTRLLSQHLCSLYAERRTGKGR